MKHGYLIDMDGVLYRGTEVITGADTFIQQLRAREIPFRLLTNNSQRTRRDVVAKLNRMGIEVDEEHIFTSAMATARFLARQRPDGTAFVIGEGGLLTALHQNGYAVIDHEPDYVVVGEGRTFNLELVEAAVRMILGGAKLVATNLDPNCPTQNGLRPGCGAMVAMLGAWPGHGRDHHYWRYDGDRHSRRHATGLPYRPGPERRYPPGRFAALRLRTRYRGRFTRPVLRTSGEGRLAAFLAISQRAAPRRREAIGDGHQVVARAASAL